MNEIRPNYQKHCYYQCKDNPRVHGICVHVGYHKCTKFNEELEDEIIIDNREDGLGHFKGQKHRFPIRLPQCKEVIPRKGLGDCPK